MKAFSSGGSTRRRVSFLAHEIAEYAVAAAVIAIGVHATGGLQREYVLAGSLLGVLNFCTRAPLGVLKAIGRRTHHAGDVAIILLLAASPFFGFVKHDVLAILASEALALVLALMEQSTRYVDPKRAPRVIEATLRPSTPGTTASRLGPAASQTLRHSAHYAGLLTGIGRRMIRTRKQERSPS